MLKLLAPVLLLASLPLMGCVVHEGPPPGRYRSTNPGPASNASAWEKLGELTVNGKADRDSLKVGRVEGRFAKLRLKVNYSALKMHNLVVVFDDGSKYSPDTRLVFQPGTTSNVIDLPGTRRAIRSIEFRYSDLAGGGRAQVEVWAR